jgi:hypothetical protein
MYANVAEMFAASYRTGDTMSVPSVLANLKGVAGFAGRRYRVLYFLPCFLLCNFCSPPAQAKDKPRGEENDWPVIFQEDFEKGMDRWRTTDPAGEPVWKITDVGGKHKHVLRVTGQSKYQPPHRSPHSIALVKEEKVGDFELTALVQNTNKTAGGHRDLCIFWGYQDSSHFYYVHYGAQADPHACQIFIVNDAPRTMITKQPAKGTPWTDGWHKLRVVRRVKDGTIECYFDDMKKPLMTAKDTTFGAGLVGIGTFDDHGNFAEIELRGVKEKK